MANWKYRIDLADIFHDEDMPFEEKRDEIIKRIRESEWYRVREADREINGAFTLKLLLDDLAEAQDGEEFHDPWMLLYELADLDMAWIETIMERVK